MEQASPFRYLEVLHVQLTLLPEFERKRDRAACRTKAAVMRRDWRMAWRWYLVTTRYVKRIYNCQQFLKG